MDYGEPADKTLSIYPSEIIFHWKIWRPLILMFTYIPIETQFSIRVLFHYFNCDYHFLSWAFDSLLWHWGLNIITSLCYVYAFLSFFISNAFPFDFFLLRHAYGIPVLHWFPCKDATYTHSYLFTNHNVVASWDFNDEWLIVQPGMAASFKGRAYDGLEGITGLVSIWFHGSKSIEYFLCQLSSFLLCFIMTEVGAWDERGSEGITWYSNFYRRFGSLG